MLIDFSQIEPVRGPGMNHGAGEMTAQMVIHSLGRFVLNRIHPYGSIGIHEQKKGKRSITLSRGLGLLFAMGKRNFFIPVAVTFARKVRFIRLKIRESMT